METRFDELKRYVRFTEHDARRLRALGERAEPHFARIAQEFYERIREHEDAHAVFTGEDQIQRLQRSLVDWLGRLLGGRYDEEYFAQTERIGRVHVKVGLPQHYMFTAMAQVRSSLVKVADEIGRDAAADTRDALSRLLDMELAIMVDGYREDMASRLARANEAEQEAQSRRFERIHGRAARVVELAGVLMISLDERGRILLFNPEAERVTGYAVDEAVGRDFVELLLPADLREANRSAFHAGAGECRRRINLPLTTRAGKSRDIEWRLTPTPQTDRSPDDLELVITGRDVTEERVATQRTQQQDRLAAVGTLAAGLAHEIRNPLNGAQLHIAFLERELGKARVKAEARDAVRVVDEEIKRLARLVTEFLEFARPRPLDRKPTSVRALCERAVTLVAPIVPPSVELLLNLPSTDVVVEADAERLVQVLFNLLENAVEAVAGTDARPDALRGKIQLRARREPRTLLLEVEDDGPGIPGQGAPIFDAFYSMKPKGTGLGLAIVHRNVTDHGGTIDVDSKPGRTRFRVTLPLTSPSQGATS